MGLGTKRNDSSGDAEPMGVSETVRITMPQEGERNYGSFLNLTLRFFQFDTKCVNHYIGQ